MAKKRVFDIIPPSKKIVAQVFIPRKRKFSFLRTFLWLLIISLFIFFGLREFLFAKKAIIEIVPKTRPVSFEAMLNAEEGLSDIDLLTQKVPLSSFEEEITLTKKFKSSQQEVKEKAHGIIRVYNKTASPITLIANTRFQSSTEPPRVFLTTQRIVVPANGSIDVEVVAAEPGEEYNIEPSSFSIPGLRKYSAELFYNVYGKSLAKMEGGKSRLVYKITQDDVKKAQETLLEDGKQQVLSKIKEKNQKIKILEKTLKVDLIDQRILYAEIGDEKEDFLYQIKIKANIKGIREEDVLKFAQEFIRSKISSDKEINSETLKFSVYQENVDLEGKVTLLAKFEGEIYTRPDKDALKDVSKGQTKQSIKKYIAQIYPEIQREPRIKFSPFFVKKAPPNSSDIDILITFR